MSPFIGCCHPPAAWGIEAIPRLKEGSEGLLVVDQRDDSEVSSVSFKKFIS